MVCFFVEQEQPKAEAKPEEKKEEKQEEKPAEEKKEESKEEKPAEEEKKEEPKPPSPCVLFVDLHCVGCAKKIERSIMKMRGNSHHLHFSFPFVFQMTCMLVSVFTSVAPTLRLKTCTYHFGHRYFNYLYLSN